MKKTIWIVLLSYGLLGCVTNQSKESGSGEEAPAAKSMAKASMATGKSIRVLSTIPYSKNHQIEGKILRECNLNDQLSQFIDEFGDSFDVNVVRTANIDKDGQGMALMVEITNATSEGNAFLGHRKTTSIAGQLYEDGKLKASFQGMRVSGGGAFGGFKGSCSVLGRTVEALGKDVALWLKNPFDNARLGDL
ncbi:hypothetical protein [Kaarinaea lacus]